MKSQKKIILIVLILLILLLVGALCVFYFMGQTTGKESAKKPREGTFGEFTEIEELWDVPAIVGDGISLEPAREYGDGNYVIGVEDSSLAYYQEYLKILEADGYEKQVDNGENGLENSVYTTTYTKDNLVLTVTHVVNIDKTYISAGYDKAISEHLFYKDEYTEGVGTDKKTTMYMVELIDTGNSFVYQLKNGHFIIEDGGGPSDAPYLLDFLEALTPQGEKPVIEGWFVTHPHSDHMGALSEIIKKQTYINRIYVDGIYYCAPNLQEIEVNVNIEGEITSSISSDEVVRLAANMLTASDGGKAGYYRPRTGERYYFCDIMIDIVLCQEQLAKSNYIGTYGRVNESSTVLMYNIEGQKILAGGDGDAGVMKTIMRTYGKEYLNVDVFNVLHHGINTIDLFTNYCTAKTALFTSWSTNGQNKNLGQNENQYLKENVEEYYAWGTGTVMLTFPYQVGEAEILPKKEWIYNATRKFSYSSVMPERYDGEDSATWKEEVEGE